MASTAAVEDMRRCFEQLEKEKSEARALEMEKRLEILTAERKMEKQQAAMMEKVNLQRQFDQEVNRREAERRETALQRQLDREVDRRDAERRETALQRQLDAARTQAQLRELQTQAQFREMHQAIARAETNRRIERIQMSQRIELLSAQLAAQQTTAPGQVQLERPDEDQLRVAQVEADFQRRELELRRQKVQQLAQLQSKARGQAYRHSTTRNTRLPSRKPGVQQKQRRILWLSRIRIPPPSRRERPSPHRPDRPHQWQQHPLRRG